jgi:hypothetical protein
MESAVPGVPGVVPAVRERSGAPGLDEPEAVEMFGHFRRGVFEPRMVRSVPHFLFRNSNLFQHSALVGDMPLMEALVAHGEAIDLPFFDEGEVGRVPVRGRGRGRTALAVACANLAVAESDHPALVQARPGRPWRVRGRAGSSTESAMCARCSWCGSGPTPPGPSALTRQTTPSSSSSFERSAS